MGVEVPIGALRPFSGHWWIAGGWAAELFLGEQTRVHDDVDVAVLRRDEHELVELVGAERVGEHQLRADGFDVLLNDADGDQWIFRRETRVTLPLDHVGTTRDGVPLLAPEIVLLFKAKNPQAKDEADRALLEPRLDVAAREWLCDALRTAYPDHRWLA